jgi:hypothetical protein
MVMYNLCENVLIHIMECQHIFLTEQW